MISVGVQTWGTDVALLRRYWAAAESLGYHRLTYGDGLWGWTHDGWTMLGAVALLTRRVRIGRAVTYCFDSSSHHPSWLAKAAVKGARLAPRPLQAPRPPVWVAAMGARALEVAARHADGWEAFYDTTLVGEPATVLERIAEYRSAGATDLMCAFADFPETGMLERFAEHVLPFSSIGCEAR